MAQRGVFKTSLGGEIPVYKVSFTKAEYEPYKNDSSIYSFPESGYYPDLMPDPFLTEFRDIMKDVYSGHNNTAFFEHEGVGYLLNSDMTYNADTRFTATTGETQAKEEVGGLVYSKYILGSISPGWTEGGLNNKLSYRRPLPNEFHNISTSIGSPVALLMDADNKLYRFSYGNYFNIAGIQDTHVGSLLSGPLSADFDASVLYYEERESFGDPTEPDEPTEPIERFNPRVATSTIGLYRANKEELFSFVKDVWTTDLLENINSFFIGDGSDALLGITWYYGLRDTAPVAPADVFITLGNVPYRNSGIYKALNKEFVTYDFGSIKVPASYGDYRDYTLCKYTAYLPFVGEFVDLNADEVVNKDLYLKYTINLSDGSAMCYLSTNKDVANTKGLLFSSPCMWGYDIPFKADSVKSAGAWVAGYIGSVAKMSIDGMSHMTGRSYSTGSGAGNEGVLGDFVPKLIIYKQDDLSGQGFVTASGMPSADTVAIGDCAGFLQVSNVYNAGTLPFRGGDKIIAMLKEGIYI